MTIVAIVIKYILAIIIFICVTYPIVYYSVKEKISVFDAFVNIIAEEYKMPAEIKYKYIERNRLRIMMKDVRDSYLPYANKFAELDVDLPVLPKPSPMPSGTIVSYSPTGQNVGYSPTGSSVGTPSMD